MDRINYNLLLDIDSPNVFDLTLVTDIKLNLANGSLFEGVITDDLAFYYDFNNYSSVNSIYSLINYSEKKSSGFTISDIGLTGIDTGYVPALTGETISFSTGSTLTLKPVTGTSSTYPMQFVHELNLNRKVLQLSGGFYQGFYKLDGYYYEMIPNRTEEGFTVNYWINRDFTGFHTSALTSDNFFFFMGSRAENKFHAHFSGETTVSTTTGIPLSGQTGTTTDVTGFGLFYNLNEIGFRQVITRQDESGVTSVSVFGTGKTLQLDADNHWINVTATFTRNQPLILTDDCGLMPKPIIPIVYSGGCTQDIPDTQKGKLKIFINARPLMEVVIEEPIFRRLNVDKDVQQGVPYNISIGGGTLGLLESQTFGGVDPSDANLFMVNNFGGSFVGQIGMAAMYTRPLTIPEIIRNFSALQDIYKVEETFGGAEIIVNDQYVK